MTYLRKFWDFIGTDAYWFFLFFVVVVTKGATVAGLVYAPMCLIAYFLSRIASALEKMAARTPESEIKKDADPVIKQETDADA